MTPTEQALEGITNAMELLREGSLNITHCKLLFALHGDTIKQALQAQAEKDRVMKMMADKGKRVMDLLEKHGGSIVPHLLDTDENAGREFREALSEYNKLGGTRDE